MGHPNHSRSSCKKCYARLAALWFVIEVPVVLVAKHVRASPEAGLCGQPAEPPSLVVTVRDEATGTSLTVYVRKPVTVCSFSPYARLSRSAMSRAKPLPLAAHSWKNGQSPMGSPVVQILDNAA